MKKLNLDVQLTLPKDGVGWIARVEVLGTARVRIGVGDGTDAGSAFCAALLVACASGCTPDGSHIS